ncbi:hypothetical protein T492DRAFT_1001558 [Pavlovales sp. CCMP2436]|nr:hypothetical protein T492DRAFT_1001558 [Pavlovales sp. CCMP2436]|mmetsp:Transcript_24827/g.62842  ORF Transcript_24827/g.62842 Transcript_24827/m.62842 type:complete len:171 (-) Transcript_24827:188-700(-)
MLASAVLLLAGAALFATGADALAHFSPASSSRVRATGSSSYRLHRVAPSSADERSSLSLGTFETGTRLHAVQQDVEVFDAPRTLRSNFLGKAKFFFTNLVSDLANPRQLANRGGWAAEAAHVVLVSVLVVAWRHLAARGSPLQLALVTACIVLEIFQLALQHDGSPPSAS